MPRDYRGYLVEARQCIVKLLFRRKIAHFAVMSGKQINDGIDWVADDKVLNANLSRV